MDQFRRKPADVIIPKAERTIISAEFAEMFNDESAKLTRPAGSREGAICLDRDQTGRRGQERPDD